MNTKSHIILWGMFLFILNTIGLIWIHHSLVTHKETVRVHSIQWVPDNINPDRIKVTFDRDVALPEAIGNPIADLFKIEPRLDGKWMWASLNAAEFLLASPVGPGREIRLEPSENFKDMTSMRFVPEKALCLRTISLSCVRPRILSSDHHYVTIEMEFNQPVEPGDLLRHTKFYDNTQPQPSQLRDAKILTQSISNKVVLQIPRPASDLLQIVLDENMRGYQADLPLGKTMAYDLKVDPGFIFLRSAVSSNCFETAAAIQLEFSKELNKDATLPPISIKPEVKNLKTRQLNRNLILNGDFEPAKQYYIEIPSTISSAENQTLGKNIQVRVDIPDRDSGIMFVHPGGILSLDSQKILDLKAVNITGLELKSWRIYDNNLVSYLHRNSRDQTSQYVHKKKLELDLPRNEILEFAIELHDLIEPGPGIYYVSASDPDHYWNNDSTLVILSDLAITSKKHSKGVLVWVTSVQRGEPVKNVIVKGLSYQNQVLTQAVTDGNGIAQLEYASINPEKEIWLITAQLEKDLNYIKPAESQWVIDDVDQSGRPWPQSLEIMLYSERGVYRPGDEIHLTGIVRDKNGRIPPVMPFTLKTLRPDGKEVENTLVKAIENGQGIFHKSIRTTTDFQTGIYTFRVTLPGSEEVLGTTQASVEAFIPLRMKVESRTSMDRYGPTEIPSLHVTGQYLWGQPASDLPVNIHGLLEPRQFQSETYSSYYFGVPAARSSIAVPQVSQKLDEQGEAAITITLPDSLKAGLYKLYLTATVTEPGARSVSSNTSTLVDTSDHHIGLKTLADQIIPPNEPVHIEWVSLTGQEQPCVTSQLSYELFSIEYHTVLKVVNQKRVWQSEEKLSSVKAGPIASENQHQGAFDINCPASGYYRLRVQDAKTASAAEIDFYASADAAKHSLKMNEPEHLEIITDRKDYLPGQEVGVLIRSPVSGKAWITIETDHVVHYQFAQLKGNSLELTLPISDAVRGSACISAMVVRGIDPNQKDWLPHRAYGMNRIRIDHHARQLPVTIEAPDKIEPEQNIAVTVSSSIAADPNHPPMIHLWAVDEGILLASDYKTPDPFHFFFLPRRPGVFSSDLYGHLLPDYDRPKSMMHIGADDSSAEVLRRNPVPTRYRQPNVIWNQVLPADEKGRLQVQMKLPPLIGQLRLMAVAVDQDRYGQSQKPLICSRDLMVESSCPRFAAPGDIFMIPVKIFNASTKPISVKLDVEITGPLRIEMPENRTFLVAPQKPCSLLLKAAALEIGPVDLKISAEQLDAMGSPPLAADAVSHFSIRPSTALHSEIVFRTIEAGESLTISPSDSFIAGTERLNLKVFSSPSIQLAPALEQLIGYPYGCVEQTTSRLFGLLNARHILDPARADSLAMMIQAGFMRLWGMQTRSGGLSYWPGETQSYPWGSVYAGWCLMEARKAGYTIDSRFSDELMGYLETLLGDSNTDEIDYSTRALLCRVLADYGRPPVGWMNSLAERKDRLDIAGLAHLAAAFHKIGQKDAALELLPVRDVNLAIPTSTSGCLTSGLCQQSILLSVLLEMDSSQDMMDALAADIGRAQSNGAWQSTLENAAAITALSRYQIQASRPEPDFTGQILFPDGPAVFDHKQPYVYPSVKIDKSVSVTTQGTGRIYIARTSEGLVRPDLLKPYDKRISVKRTWLDREKKIIDPNQLKVGDLVHVEIELTLKDNRWVDNIAVVDALPAAMEVENPRLASSAQQEGYEEDPIRTEFLDDRVILFCSAGPEKQTYRYALRVIASGTFEIPPIQASCMYDPSVASMGTPGTLTVKSE